MTSPPDPEEAVEPQSYFYQRERQHHPVGTGVSPVKAQVGYHTHTQIVHTHTQQTTLTLIRT